MTIKLALLLGSAALALWVYVRFVARTPQDWRLVLVHLGLSALVVTALVPSVMRVVLETPSPGSAVVAVVGVALPAFTYVFLASLWLLALTGRALGGGLR
jgi:hypothetical protein